MTQSITRIFVHANWTTHHRARVINGPSERALRAAMFKQAGHHRIAIVACGFDDDHTHVLLRLGAEQSIAGAMKMLKGYTALVLLDRTRGLCHWQRGYFATSVSESDVRSVAEYVSNQRLHHADGTTNAAWECA